VPGPQRRILVVAAPPDGALIAAWLREDGLGTVRTADGSAGSLRTLGADPPEVIILDAGLTTIDALTVASALRSGPGPAPLLVLVADAGGRVRNAADAAPYRSDRFLRRPLAQAALTFAVRSCLQLGRAAVVDSVLEPPAATAAAFAVLGEIGPAPRAEREVASDVARHALAARIEEATAEAVEAFLSDKLEEALSLPPAWGPEAEPVPPVIEEVAISSALAPVRGPTRRPGSAPATVLARVQPRSRPATAPVNVPVRDTSSGFEPAQGDNDSHDSTSSIVVEVEPAAPRRTATVVSAPDEEPVTSPHREPTASRPPSQADDEPVTVERVAPAWRDPTVVLNVGPAVGPAAPVAFTLGAPEEARTGTFVSALRQHMSAVEARLFGDASGGAALDDGAPPDIDLDAIGVTAVTPLGPGTTDLTDATPEPPPLPPPARAPEPRSSSIITDLADEHVAALLGRLARERFTGRVSFRRAEAQKIILFDDGRPIFASSNQTHDRMGELLVREGKITRDQITRASDVVTQSGRRMGEILVDLGYLKRRELLPAVRRHIEDILYSLFSWESGTVTTVAGGTGREEKIRLAAPPTALVVEGIRRKLGAERLRALLGANDTVLVPTKPEELLAALADADLGTDERQAVELFDGERDLAAVTAASTLAAEQVLQLAFALVALGLVRTQRRAVTEPAARVTAPSAWPSGSQADLTIDRERILAKHAHVRDGDYFEVLGVRRDATPFEIRRAFDAARRDYAPDAFAPELARELGAELGEIATVLGEAQRVLGLPAVRQSYLAHLVDRE
jgi:CheY-like chemotaxis protein